MPGDATPVSLGLNSRLVKSDGALVEHVQKVGGRYTQAIERMVGWLEKAAARAENDAQRAALDEADRVLSQRQPRGLGRLQHRVAARHGVARRPDSTASSRSTTIRSACAARSRASCRSAIRRRRAVSARSPAPRSGSRITCRSSTATRNRTSPASRARSSPSSSSRATRRRRRRSASTCRTPTGSAASTARSP